MDLPLFKQVYSPLDRAKVLVESCEAKDAAAKRNYEVMTRLEKQNEDALDSKIVFDVSGTLFSTTKDTLLRVKDSYFTCLLASGHWKPQKDGTYFIDRSPKCFGMILDYMRYGALDEGGLTPILKKMLREDFDYFFPNVKLNGEELFPRTLCSDYLDTLQGWLTPWGDKFDGTKLLWRGSRDGFTAKAFHRRCNSMGPTLTVIESSEGWIFGGFNPTHWQFSSGGYSKAVGAFLFTLKNPLDTAPTRYLCTNPSFAIYNHAYFGPTFGSGRDLAVFPNGGQSSTCPYTFRDVSSDKVVFTSSARICSWNTTTYFDVKEIEVYSV